MLLACPAYDIWSLHEPWIHQMIGFDYIVAGEMLWVKQDSLCHPPSRCRNLEFQSSSRLQFPFLKVHWAAVNHNHGQNGYFLLSGLKTPMMFELSVPRQV